jgi:hypothetical protein
MSNITISSSNYYQLQQSLTNGQNITFANDVDVSGGLILSQQPRYSNFTVTNTNGVYYATLGGGILNFQPATYTSPGDHITIQVVTDLLEELFPAGTANPDYTSLVSDMTFAAGEGIHFEIKPSGTVVQTSDYRNFFTLDAAQQQAIKEIGAALFGTSAAADGATLDFAFGLRENPQSHFKFIDTAITTNIAINPCFAAGTRILTANGEIPVETLNIGDTLITHDGEEHPILWIGRRTINLTTHPRPETVRPVLIEPGALSENTPARRLTISPDHALYLEGVLVPAKELLNWNSIRQDTTATTITYYHLELERHGIIFAEATPAETYLDTGHRGAFDNADTTVVAHLALMQQRRTTESCAPLCLAGPQLAHIRQRIAARLVGVRLG